jgi:hypothetical protein
LRDQLLVLDRYCSFLHPLIGLTGVTYDATVAVSLPYVSKSPLPPNQAVTLTFSTVISPSAPSFDSFAADCFADVVFAGIVTSDHSVKPMVGPGRLVQFTVAERLS